MLEILNRYAHGLASIPMLDALRARGCLARLSEMGPFSADQLARDYSANRAYLDVALRMLVCLDWIRPGADGFEATPALADSSAIPDRIMDLCRFPFDQYVQGGATESIEPWLERSERRWSSEHPYLPDFLDGLLVVPLLLSLRASGGLGVEKEDGGTANVTLRLNVDPAVRHGVERLFMAKGWASRSGDVLHVNRAGRFIIDRIFVTATVASYRPMFERAQELLFGDAAAVFALDAAGHEGHVDRTLNVIGSGFQHEKYFAALSDVVVRSFDHDDFPSQPKYIVDMGCGDGSLLRRLYETVRDRTRRGKVLDTYPLILVAADFNEKALAEASRTLDGLDHIAVKGDIGDPLALLDTLRTRGEEDLHRVLHVRSFLDHNRPYLPPQDRKAAGRRSQVGGGIYIDAEGRAIPPGDMIQSTVEHLRRWSQVVNEHGLVVLEVHCLAPDVTARYLDESENFHFDAYHALSHQYLHEAQTFLACAAEAGLFCRHGHSVGFPRNLPFTRISLNHFERRPYLIRCAHDEDLPVLAQLDEVWPSHRSRLSADKAVPAFEPRSREIVGSEFVLETEGGVVASVRCDQEETIRLISMHARPGTAASHLRDLLQFVEQYWALAGVSHVIGIEDCRSALSEDDETSVARAVAHDLRARVARYPFAAGDDPRAAERELGTFSFRWLLANLQRMGVMRYAGEAYDLDALERRLGVAPKYRRYFDALMRRLQDEGLVKVRGRRMETTPLVSDYALTPLEERVAEFKQGFQHRYPANVGLMNLTACCLDRYEEIITGRIDITEVVFQNGNMDVFAEIFRGGVVSDFFNRIVADAVHDTVVRLKATAPKIRILEIGAGTGATTTAILEVLQSFSGLVEFCFSDISPSFIRNARRRFAERYPSIEYRLLNIEEDPSRQGFEAHQFDIVVAANVLHDTRNIELALEQVRKLLRPGGLLVMDEYTSVKDCLFFSGALLHGYWLFQDPERRLNDSCLLGVSQWSRALERTGFAVVGSHALPTQSLDASCGQCVMLCEALGKDDTEELRAHATDGEVTDRDAGSRKAEIVGPLVEQQVLALLGEERASAYSSERPVMDMGLDSIELVELKSLMERHLGVKLSPMFLFEHETPAKMTAALSEMVSNQQLQGLSSTRLSEGTGISDRPGAIETTEVMAPAEEKDDAIAIVGVACRFPGGAASAESFWELLDGGRHGIVSMPAGRWRWPAFVDLGGEYRGIDKAGFLEHIDEFDAPFFRTSPKEAKLMDPQQRLLLELSWEAMEDGGHRPSELSGRKIGVFVGVCHGDYREVLTTASDLAEAYVGTGSAYSLLANRLSYFYDFKGQSLTVDTACSSSLFALHHAVAAIRRGDCEQALVGAANLFCSPTNSISYYRAGMLSPTGKCRTFDETADGYVRGEGGAMLLLKPLATALAEGDSIYGLVKGTAVNHGGQAASLTAPKPEAQAAVIEAAWQAADVSLESVGYMETHGTGTRLGDPVEVGGLIEAFRRLYKGRGEAWPERPHCGLGSVKPNIGHLEGAAGLAGLIKVLMAIQHRSIPATLNFERLNPDINLAGSPFYIVERNQVWKPCQDERGRELPRRAGVSSFGFGGANAHAVIEEYPRSRKDAEPAYSPWLIPLSARNDERLVEQARRLLEFIESGIGGDAPMSGARLAEVAYTLQVGREAMEERVAFVVQTREELVTALSAYIAGERTIPNCNRGHSELRRALAVTSARDEQRQKIETSIASKDLAALAALWVDGAELDWTRLSVARQRTHLPTYPFAKERYWIDAMSGGNVTAKVAASAVLHPLLHSNTSDLAEQRYSSTFTGDEFFLMEQAANPDGGTKLKVLPGVACLEMARAAIEQALPVHPESPVLELRNTVWAQPIVLTDTRKISISLVMSGPDQVDYEIYTDDAEQEIVHCQGRAVKSRQPAPARLDLEKLVGRDQVLAPLRLPRVLEETAKDFILHPSLMHSALQAAMVLNDDSSQHTDRLQAPFALETLRIFSPCRPEMVAWARYAAGSQSSDPVVKVDIDLCDAGGNVSVQMRSVSWRRASPDVVEPVIVNAAPSASNEIHYSAPARKEVVFVPFGKQSHAPVGQKKPAAISLASPGTQAPATATPSQRPESLLKAPITLSTATSDLPVQESAVPALSTVKIYDDGNGIFSIHFTGPVSSNASTDGISADLLQAMERLQQEASLKVLILRGIQRCFGRNGREAYNEALEQKLYQALVCFPCPVIAVLAEDAVGASFLAAALCDFMVCNEDASYGYTDAQRHCHPTIPEVTLFSERFGSVRAQDLLYVSTALTGRQLRTKGWTCPILPAAQVEAYAMHLASSLATKSQTALGLLKQHLTRQLAELVKALTPVHVVASTDAPSDHVAEELVSPAAYIHIETRPDNVLIVKLCVAAENIGLAELVSNLGHIFARVHESASHTAVVLTSEYSEFFPETERAIPEHLLSELGRLIIECRVPVVAALDGNARGHAWLMSQYCDACVYNNTGVYSAAGIRSSPALERTSAAIFMHRFGSDAGREILFTGADYRGVDLQHRVGTLIVAEHDHVLSAALRVAETWSRLPRATLAAWKKHTAATLQDRIGSLSTWREQKDDRRDLLPTTTTAIPLLSRVVTATAHPDGIVVVRLEDREAKNMFSDALMEGIREAFAHIDQALAYKVVILTGYDSYFASGGTKEGLLAIQGGKSRFTDFKMIQAALDCKLPVIAAMQGHGIGAGWTMGLFADVVLLSDESRYVSPYMDYGFTPGAGATWILADRIGQDLARESLLTAQLYTGSELKDRGLSVTILPRAELYPAAMALARQIALMPRARLIGLKQQLTEYVHRPLEETYRLELSMHEKTFVGQPETLAHIQNRFYQEAGTSLAGQPQAQAEPANPSTDVDVLTGVLETLKLLLANELQMRASNIGDNTQFVDLGLDSISGVTWVRKINERYHTSIGATKVYSYPTLTQMSRYVKEEAGKQGTLSLDVPGAVDQPVTPGRGTASLDTIAAKPVPELLRSRRSRAVSRFVSNASGAHSSHSIAVIGMAGQFPQARTLDEFWLNIAQGKNCITEVSQDRWNVNAYYDAGAIVAGKTNSQWAGSLDEYDRFDPLFFNISPTEAESMDPQQRLFLQTCWHAIEDAGYDPRVFSGSKCGVFAGCGNGEYHRSSRQHRLSAQGFTGSELSILAARISYVLNLQGPCVSIDTACSSSLVAIAQACDSLSNGGSDMALAGGVYVMAGPEMHIKTSQAGMLSPEGKCFTFDQRADGFVPGEGVGVVLLKRLADAQRDQDIIYGVIRGWGVNQDGKTNGITAPNPESQTRLEQEVYDRYEIDPANIQLIEAHGTGTKLGDPIEVDGLKASFQKYTQRKDYCALGSVKSNIGHCLWAAGIAGFIKLVLALKNKQLPPTINFERLNEHIDLRDSPFYVNSRLQEWKLEGEGARQAAISSFAFSGTNAHIVIGEYLAPAEIRPPVTVAMQNGKIIVPLSARTADQLQQKARDLLDFIRREGPSADLLEVAYTLQTGRQPMEERVGFLAGSLEQLAGQLEDYVEGKLERKAFDQGLVRRGGEGISIIIQDDEIKETILDKWLAAGKLSKLLDLWVKGLDLDWNRLYGEIKPRRLRLPVYPFAKERYWIETASGGHVLAESTTTSVLHPLLHSNTSDLSEQRYRSNFTGDEFFLADHIVRMDGRKEHKILPGVAYLEMTRAAIERALPARPESPVLELRNIIWAQPMIVARNVEMGISLLANDNDEVDFEIYSQDGGQETIHCQGRAVWSSQAPVRLEIEQLKTQMAQGQVDADRVYASMVRMGIIHGPAFQAITGVLQGSGQLLAHLRLPATVEDTAGDYVLHPSLMDGALQGHIGLIAGWSDGSRQTRLPFALETLRVLSPCTREMVAWVRYASGGRTGSNVVKVDVDLCDLRGNVCVQMRGFSSRLVGKEISVTSVEGRPTGSLLAVPVWQASGPGAAVDAIERESLESHVVLIELSNINDAEVAPLFPRSHCHHLQAPQDSVDKRYSNYALWCFERILTILQDKRGRKVLVQIVVADGPEQTLLEGLSGLLKTAMLENPQFAGQVIIVPAHTTADDLGALLRAEQRQTPDPVIRYKDGARQIRRWQEIPQDHDGPPIAFRDNGVYLITGGLGGLGLLFAKEILSHTRQARVILAGRSGVSAENQTLLEGLSTHAGSVAYCQVDVGDLEQVRQLISAIKAEHGQLNGILHAAGKISDRFILKKTSTDFSAVLAPKVAGTFNLDQASQDEELDFFVLFSSIAGAMGNLGQADYATANAFMDRFAAYRNRQVAAKKRQGRTRSINWPLWLAGGMGLDPVRERHLQQTTGMQPMETATGMNAFHRSLALPYDQVLVAEGDLEQMRRSLLAGTREPFEWQAKRSGAIAAIDSESLAEKTLEYLRKQFSGLLTLPSQNIDPLAALEKYGVDSILAMKLTNELERQFGSLPKTLFFEYQTIRELTEYFIGHHSKELAELFAVAENHDREAVPRAAPFAAPAHSNLISTRRFGRSRSAASSTTTDTDSIAIIGLSGRYPGAVNIEAYWHNLRAGKDCIIEVPKERWDWQAYFSEDRNKSGSHYSRWGGFIDGVDEFDALFFNVSPREAQYIDPQERLFLEHAWMAVEDAGYTRASLQVPDEQDLAGQVGVYAGVWCNEYQLFGAEASLHGERLGFAISVASIANRVSYALNLHGPSMTLDTMCSSSLAAIHVACQDLKVGRISLAIAGGVNVNIHPNKYLMLSAVQAISTDGHCRSFGDGGDGYVPAEGVGVVVLKRLSEARRDGDHIYGTIRGSVLNHGGKTNGYSVPNPQAQASAISRALTESRTDARHVSYIETHGTGTKLGDPIEIAALNKAFQQYTQDTEFCPIGSVKSNIGHCESAAGVAGLTKVLLQIQHEQLVPSLHSAHLNSNIDFHESPFVVNQTLRPWEQPLIDGRRLPRIAGISSFGAGGSNAHMIVEEYQPPWQEPLAFTKVAILLSAKTAEQLQQKARDLLGFVQARPNTIDLVAMAYTLQTGREAMEVRLAFVVSSAEQLADKLHAYAAAEQGIDDAYQGEVKRDNEALSVFSTDADLQQTVDKWIANRKLSKLLGLWVKGLEIDWTKLYDVVKPHRISLPTYPFAKERHWIEMAAGGAVSAKGTATTVLHPLLHSNTSDLNEQRYSSVFTGEEFFLADHQVNGNGLVGQKMLPAVVYLEMARAAIELALPAQPPSTVLELQNTVWAQPIVVDQKMQISITLSASADGQIEYRICSQDAGRQIVHCQGQAVVSRQPAPAMVDLVQLEAQMTRGKVEPESVYTLCARMGLVYGPAFQAITAIHQGSAELLAWLRLPRSVEGKSRDYVLHPSLMDGALQACIGLIDGWSEGSTQPRLPFALESLRVVSPCTSEMVAWVRYAPGSKAGDRAVKLDIDLCDAHGRVCVCMKGFSARALEGAIGESRTSTFGQAGGEALPENAVDVPVGLVTLVPVWVPVQVETGEVRPRAGDRVVVIGGDEEGHRGLWQICPGAEVVNVDGRATGEEISGSLTGGRRIDHVVWILPAAKERGGESEAFLEEQEEGVLLGFRLIKALLHDGYGAGELAWTVITNDTQSIGGKRGQNVDAAHSSVHGLIGSMAKEYPMWKVRLVDVDGGEWQWEELLQAGWDERGDGWAYREGQWYQRRLAECELGDGDNGGFKRGGVYVVVGGAGGVGEVVSDYLINRYDARVVWIGRRGKDEAIEKKRARVAANGGEAPFYIAADARNREELERACGKIKERYGRVNGVIHSTIVLADRALANMSEEQFRAGLSAKVDVAVHLAQTFGREALDFILYFSSVQSFVKAPGQSNYAAGCTFTDAFAEWQSVNADYPVKVMNWGYWGSVGIVAGAEYEERMAQAGLGSIEPEEGMLALEQLLVGSLAQTALVKIAGAGAMAKLQPGERVRLAVHEAVSVMDSLKEVKVGGTPKEPVEDRNKGEELDRLLGKVLLTQLHALGAFAGQGISEWRRKLGLSELNTGWVEESLRTLAAQGSISRADDGWRVKEGAASDLQTAWDEWDKWKQKEEEGGQRARVRLVDATLRALPEILRGKRLATEVLFPDSSMELVEGIYQENAVADYFNETLAGLVAGYVEERFKLDRGVKLRILEIGAGTGGSSAAIFRKLAGQEERIEEYAFTDISKAFLLRAEQRYGSRLEYLKCGMFNVEQPVWGEGIEPGSYDVVVAGNVLHATRNIRETLRNSKAALKRNGILLLNELTANSLFLHLTFGLTEGWWRFEDAELRLSGCPVLSAGRWQQVLRSEGFASVTFPVHQASALGQQIIAAESDGVIRAVAMRSAMDPNVTKINSLQKEPGELPVRRPVQPTAVQPAKAGEKAPAITGQMIERHVRSMIRDSIAEALKIEESRIQDDRSFADYGVDSIIAVSLVNRISQQCGLTLPVTIVFDHNNVEQLMKYLIREHRASVLAMVQTEAGSSVGRETVEEAPGRAESGPNRLSRKWHWEEQAATAGGKVGAVAPRATGKGIYHRVVVERPGSVRDLKWIQSEITPLRAHEVRIAVRAFSLNFGDLLCVQGLYPNMPAFPFTPGFEVSGTVVAVGEGVSVVEIGAEVIAVTAEAMGGQATAVTCSDQQVFRKPDALSFDEACSLLTVGVTMMDAFRKAQLKRGEKILIQTAAGGTGLIAVQLAKHAGAEIYATAGAHHKLEYLRTLGVRNTINYRQTDFEQEIQRMTGGNGVDVVINTLPGEAIQKGLNCLAGGGRYIEIAMTGLKSAKKIDLSVLSNNQSFFSVDLIRLIRKTPELLADYCHELMALVERGIVRPTISDVVEFPEIQEAYRRLENRSNIGKVVITVPEPYRYRESGMREATANVVTVNRAGALSRDPIAIVGMSGRFGRANSIDELWECLARGEDLTEEISRWRLNEEDAKFCPRGGFLQEIDRFDPLFFKISGMEATYMDPQQRVFLEEAWKALEDAGYAGAVLAGRQCGVYVGCASGDYQQLFPDKVPGQAFWGNAGSVIPARIAYYLNLQGPAVAVDTACSSSLVAIHLACQALWTGEVEMGIAGGVFLQSTPGFHLASGGAGMLSPSGRCYTFDDRADGFVPGEGVGVIVLKRLRDAIAHGDHIYGVVRGSGINQDGTTNGITAPSAASQERLERQVYETFRIHPEEIQMVEAHGTGTKLGDPVEYQALTRSFQKDTGKKNYCAIGSIKTNIGHTATAAGVAGVIKALLSLQHRQIPPSLNYENGNPHIDFDGSPFYVNTCLREWTVEGDARRCAAVSSFGFSGTNAHIVIEEGPATERRRRDRAGYLIALSARTASQLRQQAEQLARHLERNASEECGDISYTLLLGRKHWNHRLICIAGSSAELLTALLRWLDKGHASQVSVFQLPENDMLEKASLKQYGLQCIEECRDGLDPVAYLERLAAIGELFGQGYVLPLERLFEEGDCRRVSLPTYPFARERYWVPVKNESAGRESRGPTGRVERLHPLLHENTSDFIEQSYRAAFSGEEFFLSDHVVQGRRVLPAVAYLEMVRAAIGQASPKRPESTLELLQTVWPRPFIVTGDTPISIVLSASDDEEITFEIFSHDGEQEIIHCQGRAVWRARPEPANLDIERLEGRMGQGELEPSGVYTVCAGMGLVYGVSFQAITAIHQGNGEVLARLGLPETVRETAADYFLHPSLMDGALQAYVQLISSSGGASQLRLPFTLETLRILSPCTPEMVAWMRYSPGSRTADQAVSLDVDLSDEHGNVCVQMRGLALRAPRAEMKAAHLEAIPISDHSSSIEDISGFDDALYQKLIADVINHEISVDEAVEFG